MRKLSRVTSEMVQRIFAPEYHAEVARLLAEQCGDNLAFLEKHDEQGLEPVRFAVLKLSRGNLRELEWWVGLCRQDWPDVLRAAGFDMVGRAHQEWAAQIYYGNTSIAPNGTASPIASP